MSNCYVAAPYSVTYIISFPNFLLRWSLEISSCLFTALKFFFFFIVVSAMHFKLFSMFIFGELVTGVFFRLSSLPYCEEPPYTPYWNNCQYASLAFHQVM